MTKLSNKAQLLRPLHADALDKVRHAAKRRQPDDDGLVRQHFTLPRGEARQIAQYWLDEFPKAAYWTHVEAWRALPDDQIEFTMVRLPSAD